MIVRLQSDDDDPTTADDRCVWLTMTSLLVLEYELVLFLVLISLLINSRVGFGFTERHIARVPVLSVHPRDAHLPARLVTILLVCPNMQEQTNSHNMSEDVTVTLHNIRQDVAMILS
jgi:hypothetical protein